MMVALVPENRSRHMQAVARKTGSGGGVGGGAGAAAVVLPYPHLTVVVSGPSGAGKSTVCRRYIAQFPRSELIVTTTTRAIRQGEREGVDYRFVSVGTFKRDIQRGVFLEHALVHGNYYGSPRAEVERVWGEGKDVILEIDVQGGLEVKRKVPDAILLFLLPSDLALLRQRLTTRGTDDPATIERRLQNARGEVAKLQDYDFLVFNDDLDGAVSQFGQIVEAERHRICRYDMTRLYGPSALGHALGSTADASGS